MRKRYLSLCSLLFGITLSSLGQTTVWTGSAGDNNWNNAANWDAGLPGPGFSASISSGATVNYSSPMAAQSFAYLANSGVLNISSTGFIIDGTGNALVVTGATGGLFVQEGGVVELPFGGVQLSLSAGGHIAAGGKITANGNLLLGASGSGQIGFFTNVAGNLTVTGLRVNPNNVSSTARMVIQGGSNDLGAITVLRSGAGSGGFSALGSEGLLIYDGLVRATSIDVGGSGNSYLTMLMAGGVLTNTGDFTVRQITAGRASRFLQTGGLVVNEGPNPVMLRGHTANNSISIYAVLGGTNLVPGFTMGDLADTTGTIRLTNAAKIYVGPMGMMQNTPNTVTVSLHNGGLFGATADWTGSVPMSLVGGTFEFQASELSGMAHDITLAGVLSGPGNLLKTGSGRLILDAAHLLNGHIVVEAGILAIGPAGTLPSVPRIHLAPGATLDLTAASSFVHAGTRAITGMGNVQGNLTAAPGAIIDPGSNNVPGTLTFNGSVTQQGGVVNHFDLTGAAGAANDSIRINGDLVFGGTKNIIEVLGAPAAGAVYKLIEYTGNFDGSTDSFELLGVAGSVSNNPATKAVYLVPSSSGRAPTNIVWVGSSAENVWDLLQHTNWLNVGTGALDSFRPGDSVAFTDLGSARPMVTVSGSVAPGSLLVNSVADYTLTGDGQISGATGLLKTNSGMLRIQSTNTYSGPTILAGGAITIDDLGLAGSASPVGAANNDPANLQFNGGALVYAGPGTATDRGATLLPGGGTLGISDAAAVVTFSGVLTGPGKLTKTGAGLLDVRSVNAHQGGTDIVGGSVRIDRTAAATLGSGVVTLAGSVSSPVTFRFGGDGQRLDNTLQILGTNNFLANSGNNSVAGLSGNGDLNFLGGGTTFTVEGSMADFSGTLFIDPLQNFRLHPSTGSGNATFDLGAGTSYLNNRNGNVTIQLGSLLGGPDTSVRGASSVNNPTTYVIGGKNESTVFEGTFQEATVARKVHVVKVGTGTLTLNGQNLHTGSTTVSNGVLALKDNGSIDGSAVLAVAAPGVLSVSGRFDSTLNVGHMNSQTIVGDGTLQGALNVGAYGVLNPGLPLGNLNVTGPVTLGGTNVMELSAAGASDRITAPTIMLGGVLSVVASGSPLRAGDTFDLFDGTISGAFMQVDLPAYYTWDTSSLTANGVIRVTAVKPPPAMTGMTISGTDFNFTVTGGIPNTAVTILSSPDLITWSPALSTNFDANGTVSVSIPIGTAEKQFFTLQVQ